MRRCIFALVLDWDRARGVQEVGRIPYPLKALVKQGQPMDRGASPYQDVATLIKLRNSLIDFKPEWSDQQAAHAKLSDSLKFRIERSPFFPDAAPLFPRDGLITVALPGPFVPLRH